MYEEYEQFTRHRRVVRRDLKFSEELANLDRKRRQYGQTQSRMRLLLDRVNKRRHEWLVAVWTPEEQDLYTELDGIPCRWKGDSRDILLKDLRLSQVQIRPLMKLSLLVRCSWRGEY